MASLRVLGAAAFALTPVVAIAVACSTFSDGETTPDDDGGASEAATSDGASLAEDASSADADAGTDGAWIPCALRPSKLDPNHFCDDFDRLGTVSAPWDTVVTQNGGAAQMFDGGLSLPNAYRAFLPANTSLPGRASLLKNAPPPTSSYRIEFDVRIDSIPHPSSVNSGYSHVVALSFDDAPCMTGATKGRAVEFSFYALNQSVTVVTKGLEACPDSGNAPSTSDKILVTPSELVDGKFHHVALEISRNKCAGSQKPLALRFSFDGQDNACRPLGVDVFAESAKIGTSLGAYISENVFAQTAYVYDNVTIDYE